MIGFTNTDGLDLNTVYSNWIKYIKGGKPQIKRVLYKNPAVIVFWTDNTKTVAKCAESDVFDREKGFMIAVLKKCFLGRDVVQMLEEWIPEDDKCEEVTLSQVFKCRDTKKKNK